MPLDILLLYFCIVQLNQSAVVLQIARYLLPFTSMNVDYIVLNQHAYRQSSFYLFIRYMFKIYLLLQQIFLLRLILFI
jgi:hypothetical protein